MTSHLLNLLLNAGCDRIPIESLDLDSPECIFVMVLASAGESNTSLEMNPDGKMGNLF